MSKSTELALLQRSRSIDAPIGIRQRGGERENVGQMLDVYVNVESAEDEYLRNEEGARKELFLKGFRLYVKKLYTEEERRFLSALLSKKVDLVRLFRHMKLSEFRELKRLQEKAQANVGILKKLSELSGWSGSEEFIGEFFARMERVKGYEGEEEGTLNALVERRIQREREYWKGFRQREDRKAYMREYRKRDYVKERKKERNRKARKTEHYQEWRREYLSEYRKREDVKERTAAYYKREDVKERRNAKRREYRKREDVRAREREARRRKKEEQERLATVVS